MNYLHCSSGFLVHLFEGGADQTLCNAPAGNFRVTDAAVTCARCLSIAQTLEKKAWPKIPTKPIPR